MANDRKNGNKTRNGKTIIEPKPLPQYPVTQTRGGRPSLGSGGAERAARQVESRSDVIARHVDRATGNKD